jgi:hypothetical protein
VRGRSALPCFHQTGKSSGNHSCRWNGWDC